MNRILVIEDERSILENVMETLQLEGFDVRGAYNGRIGVEVAREYHPNLIICDIMMPELNGYGVLLELRGEKNTANIPFMFLTAKADRSDMRRGMEMGADDYLVKPFTTSELLAAVNARLDRHQSITSEYETKLEDLRENIIRALPHELRTPLTGIIGYSEMLLMDFDSIEHNQAYNMVEAIHKSGLRLHHLIENYLVYAQVELMMTDSKRVEAARNARPIASQKPITRIAMQKASAAGRDYDLALDVCDVGVRVYPDSLDKIVEELVDNAFKFSDAGSRVEVRAQPEGSFLTISIRDHGRGIAPHQLSSIGAYMQFERALYEQQGLGLGLIISKRLAELHGGQLTIDSQPGEGTIVYVRLPLAHSTNGHH
ncbi:MAG: response regulator [Chloroflexi bacterium]|nr:response regulator [Chloroflexota bacterium]